MQVFRPRQRVRQVQSITTMADLTREFVGLAAESSQAFLVGAMELTRAAPRMRLPRQRKSCDCDCDCRDTPKEPDCCQVECQTYRGERVRTPIQISNRGEQTVAFTASAQPWRGTGGDVLEGTIDLAPQAFSLAPNQSIIVMATTDVGDDFKPGSSYRADVLFSQAETARERVCLTMLVAADEQAACIVEHAPGRTAKHACHHWCDHFYCDRSHLFRASR